jgi:hypothetical protein
MAIDLLKIFNNLHITIYHRYEHFMHLRQNVNRKKSTTKNIKPLYEL